MGIFGPSRRDRQRAAEPAAGPVYLERRPDESTEAFEMRLAASAEQQETAHLPAHERRQAYAEGRRDQHQVERPRRRGFGLAGLALVLVAALGALWVILAAREGSFAAGGALVDNKLAEVTNPARVAASQAVDRTGQAVQNAGQSLESQGERIRETAK